MLNIKVRNSTREGKKHITQCCRPLKPHFLFPQLFFIMLAMAMNTTAEITWWPLTLHDPTALKTVCAYRE